MRPRTVWVLSLLALAALGPLPAACDQEGTEIGSGADASTEATLPAIGSDAAVDARALAFGACPGSFSGLCATMEAPLDYANPSGAKIRVLVDRISTSVTSKSQLWLLQGGPGGSGADLVPLGLRFAAALPDFEIYTLDHRGVGQSTRLGCSQEASLTAADASVPRDDAGRQELGATWAGCIDEAKRAWGDGLAQFSTSNAARDLARAIDLTRKQGERVFVYGVSYGTYWAHRYAQIFPSQPAGVVLDSIVPSEGLALQRFDEGFEIAGRKLADLCKADALCASKLGADPWAKLQAIRAEMRAGHCPAFGFTDEDRELWSSLLVLWEARPVVLAALHRFDRCSPEDVTVLRALRDRLRFVFAPASSDHFSQLLNFDVAFSELWERPGPSRDAIEQSAAAAVFAVGASAQYSVQAIFPAYTPDAFFHGWAAPTVPTLMLNGTMDTQTPIEVAQIAQAHLVGPNQRFVAIPLGDHGLVDQSPVKTPRTEACGFQIIASWLADPSAPPDTKCLADLAPIDFAGDADVNTFLAGTPDLWLGLRPTPAGAMPQSLERALRHVRPLRAMRR